MQSIIAAALAGLIFATTPALAQMPDDDAVAHILADRIDRDRQGVGMAVSLIEGDTPRFISHGQFAIDDPRPVGADTVFEIGSVTKLFTSLLLADMVLRGDMALDAPITDYLPPGAIVPDRNGQKITAFDLATHSSGLPRLPTDMVPADPANPYAGYSSADLYAFLATYSLPRDIGTQFEYSNLGVALLTQAITKTAGQDYETLVRTRILEPLGMTDTAITLTPAMTDRFATGHDGQRRRAPYWSFDAFAGMGAYRSTATDMAKFVAAASGAVSTPLDAAFALMLRQTRPAGADTVIGLGWFVLDHGERQLVWHNGGTGGFSSFIGFDRASKAGAVVLSNMATETLVDDIGLHLLDNDIALAPQPTPRQTIEIEPEVLENYTGTYNITPQFALTVTAEDGRLFVQASGQDRLEAFPQSQTEFFLTTVDAQLSFQLGPDGIATAIVLHQNGMEQKGMRQ